MDYRSSVGLLARWLIAILLDLEKTVPVKWVGAGLESIMRLLDHLPWYLDFKQLLNKENRNLVLPITIRALLLLTSPEYHL